MISEQIINSNLLTIDISGGLGGKGENGGKGGCIQDAKKEGVNTSFFFSPDYKDGGNGGNGGCGGPGGDIGESKIFLTKTEKGKVIFQQF